MKLAQIMMAVTRAAAAALILIVPVIWLFWDILGPKAAEMAGLPVDAVSIGVLARLSGAGLMLLGAAIQAYGLWCLSRTFDEAAQGRALSDAAIQGFERFAWTTLAMVPLGIAIRSGVIAIVSAADSVPGGFMPLAFGSAELKALFIAVLLVFVARVFRQGQAAEEENKAFL